MNKKIKQLAEEARHWAHFDGLEENPKSSPDILFERKFAELIVLESMREIRHKSFELLDIDFYPHYIERLHKHFELDNKSKL